MAAAVTDTVATTITTAIDAARRRWRRRVDLAARLRRRSVDLAARRRWRSVDLAARRRRRRSIDLAAAAPVGDGSTGDDWSTGNRKVRCFGLGGNSGGSEREDRRGHDGYPAQFQHHDASPLVVCLPTERQTWHEPGFPDRHNAISRDMVNLSPADLERLPVCPVTRDVQSWPGLRFWVTSHKTHTEHNESAIALVADMRTDIDFRRSGP